MIAPDQTRVVLPKPRNFGITRPAAALAALFGVLISVTAIVSVAIVFDRLDATQIATIVVTLGAAITGLVGALKATEAADTASKAYRTATFTASQTANLHQLMLTYGETVCPRDDCPFKAQGRGLA